MAEQLIYFFGAGAAEGEAARTDVLGGKGASLAAMSAAGLPVPPGFTIAIEGCRYYQANGKQWPAGLEEELRKYLARLEAATGKKFGAGREPLLVSVRSGAARSMPGMMDTILNCGLHPALAAEVPSAARFWLVYAQFARQFATTVAHLPAAAFEEIDERLGEAHEARARAYLAMYEEQSCRKFPATAWAALVECVNAVFESWNNERAKIYRQAHGLQGLAGTAVTVQSMFNSEVSGVAFTANPSQPAADEIIIEGSYGLGEAIVSGEVTPDRFVLDRSTLKVKEAALGHKDHVTATLTESRRAAPLDPSVACLTDEQIVELAKVALNVEKFFGYAVDIEWGLSEGRFTLLQSRAIRGLDVTRDVETGRREEIARLKELAAAGDGKKAAGKVWIVHNLAETLEAPTPLTWDIMRGFMSGAGGFGAMYADFGYRPSRRVRDEGFLELICGRIYCDADRAAEVFWEGLPFKYDHKAVLADPRILEAAPTEFDASRADEKFLMRLPGTFAAVWRCWRTMKRARRETVHQFEDVALPPYLAYVAAERRRDLTKLATAEVVAELGRRVQRVLTEFGKESLKPGFFGGCARAELEGRLVQLMGPAEGGKLCQTLTSGLAGDSTVEQNALLFEVARGQAKMEDFVTRYGHRGVGEMELEKPRWREDASYLYQIIEGLKTAESHSPASLHRANEERRERAMSELPARLAAWGGSFLREEIEGLARETQTLLPYRESGKHYLLMGYELVRTAILELGRRWNLGDEVFFLHLEELGRFEAEAPALTKEAARRRVRWQSAQKLDLPEVIDSTDLEALGLPRKLTAARELKGLSLSSGLVMGTARIVRSPNEAKNLGDDCILVCPSTDPSWTALFTTIKGLVVERGGVLSHGAITARDFSIPAVACPGATQLIRDGAKIRVDGDSGQVAIVEDN